MGKQVITPLPSAMQLKVQPGASEGSNPMKELDLSSPVGPSTDLVSGEQTPIPTHRVDLEIEVETDEPGATWSSLFKDNRSAQNDMNLTYIPPEIVNGKIVVQLDENEVEQEAEKWKCALIVFVIGEKPGFNYMRRYIEHYWKDIADSVIFLHEDGYYIVKFQSMEDMQRVFHARPYTINYKSMILKPWTPELNFTAEFLTEIPL
ncbi:hypothetical protein KY284_000604 [Solanum tuberosum]|nr:hypothetical protein KY284_000604 [Solanum tuberosum]